MTFSSGSSLSFFVSYFDIIISSLAGKGVLAQCAQGKGPYAALSFLCNLLLDGVKFGAQSLGIFNIRDDGHSISVRFLKIHWQIHNKYLVS